MKKKKIVLLGVSVFMLFSMFVMPAMALTSADLGVNYAANTGLGSADPRDVIANVIRVAMGFLGTIAVLVILVGGFKWMTAGGNESNVGEAKKWIGYGIVGLVIVLSAYGITNFVLGELINATN